MHDLLHSLAIFVSPNQYIYVDPKTFGGNGLIRQRHLRFNVENMNAVPEEIIGREYVRTLMFSTNTEIKKIPDKLLSELRRLRVLNIEGKIITTLPNSVGNMRQLRFLSISASELHMLPDSIENLENLETLMIASVLKSRSLPKGIGKLRNLRHLLVSDKPENMPNGLDNLKKLRVLDCFVVNECTSSSTSRRVVWLRKKSEDCKPNMKELKDLSELTDLFIHNLERVASKEEAKEAAIEKKTSLKCLKLHCRPTSDGSPTPPNDEDSMNIAEKFKSANEVKIKKIEEVFAGIQLPPNLRELSIDGFFGEQLPDHMTSDHLRQVTSLELRDCKKLRRLPLLGDMPKLERLHITNLLSVAELGSEFDGLQNFPKLQELHLAGMNDLVKIGAFPCLVNLHISCCPNLRSLGEGLQHATCLRSVKNLRSLKKLDINYCSALEVVQDVPNLSSLSISDPKMTTLPIWLKNTIASEFLHLAVTDSEELVFTEEDWMIISKRVEVKINGVKVDSNFPCASSSSGTSWEPVNDSMDVDTT